MTNEQHTSLRNKLKKQEELEKGKFLTGNLTGKKKEKKKNCYKKLKKNCRNLSNQMSRIKPRQRHLLLTAFNSEFFCILEENFIFTVINFSPMIFYFLFSSNKYIL